MSETDYNYSAVNYHLLLIYSQLHIPHESPVFSREGFDKNLFLERLYFYTLFIFLQFQYYEPKYLL